MNFNFKDDFEDRKTIVNNLLKDNGFNDVVFNGMITNKEEVEHIFLFYYEQDHKYLDLHISFEGELLFTMLRNRGLDMTPIPLEKKHERLITLILDNFENIT